ncbi:MAG: hypothetical protein IJY20_05980 [Clostridia bacterium]|nr:hypothetical protein [Clostridia bacterium]
MKKMRIFAMFAAVVMLLSGCAPAATPTIEYPLEFDQYRIYQSGETVYFQLSDSIKDTDNYDHHTLGMDFSSMQEFYEKITTGQFTDREYVRLKYNMQAVRGRFAMRDLNKLYVPVWPSGHDIVSNIGWRGNVFHFVESTEMCTISILDKESYDLEMEYLFNNQEGKNNISVKQVRDRNATEYRRTSHGGEKTVKILIYTLQSRGKTIYVRENYIVESSYSEDEYLISETIPSHIDIMGIDKGQYFCVDVYYPTERPSEEWLLSFGVTPFVPESEAGTAA